MKKEKKEFQSVKLVEGEMGRWHLEILRRWYKGGPVQKTRINLWLGWKLHNGEVRGLGCEAYQIRNRNFDTFDLDMLIVEPYDESKPKKQPRKPEIRCNRQQPGK